jgi:hypothetical protein
LNVSRRPAASDAAAEPGVVMKTWIIIPYDDSPAARATLRHVAQEARSNRGVARYHGVMLATAGVDPAALEHLGAEARAIAGAGVFLEVRLLKAGDPIGDFDALTASYPVAVLAAPIGVAGNAPWYTEACRFAGQDHALMLFFIRPQELKTLAQPRRRHHAPSAMRTRVRALAHRSVSLLRTLDTAWHRDPALASADEIPSRRNPSSEEEPVAADEPAQLSATGTTKNPASTPWQAS